MKVQCESCSAEYNIDDSRVPQEGLQIKCPQCSAIFVVAPPGQSTGTEGDLFELGAVDLSEEPGPEDALELDLPAGGQQPAQPELPPMPPLTGSGAAAGGSSLPPLQSSSTLPPIEKPGSSLPDIPGSQATPAPGPSPGSEGQIFDFVDQDIGADQARETPGTVRYRIRRKSGKVFGPFDAETINRMLAEHQLMGNEEASTDGLDYKPLGAFDEFAQTIRLLMDEPSAAPAPGPAPGTGTPPPSSVEGIDDLAEIESAPVAPVGVDFAEPAPAKSGPGAGTFALLGALVLLILVGVGLGFTRYGWFGYRLITGEAGVGTGDRGAGGQTGDQEPQNIGQARQAYFQDNHAGYARIIRSLGKVSGDRASPEQLYLLGLSYAAMLRNYGANETFLNKGRQVLSRLKEKASDSPEAKRVEAAFAILTRPAKALEVLEPLIGKESRDKEALYLAGWALAYQKKWDQAADLLDRAVIVDPDFVKAYQALGDIQSLQGNFDTALLFYQKALSKNPRHVISALEQARILLEVKRDKSGASQLLTRVFGKHFNSLAPSERAKAHALRARIHILDNKKQEAAADLNAAVKLMPSRGEYLAALGDLYLDDGKASEALAIFEKALKRDPKNIEARIGKGRAMWKSQKIVEAKIFLEKTARQAPKNPWPHFLLGQIAEDLVKPDQALASYRKAVDLSASFVEARVALAKLLLKQGDMKKALDQLTTAARHSPRSAVVRDGLGTVYLVQDNLRLARKEFQEALRLDPELASAHFNLGVVFTRLGKHKQAVAEYQKVADLQSDYPDLAYEHAYTLYLMKDHAGALKMYEEAIRKNPKDDRLYVRAGLAAEAAGDTSAATNYYQTAAGLNSQNVDAYFHLGVLYRRQKSHEQALDLLRQVVEMEPKNAEAHYQMGLTYQAMELMVEAIDEFRTAIQHDSKHVDASLELGKALVERLQYAEAIRCFKRVVREQPKRVDVLEALGNAYFKQNLPKKALRTYLKAYKRNPRLPGLAYRIARAYDDMEKKSKAVRFYLKAVRDDPRDPMPHYYLGFVYKAKRQNRRALSEFQTYLRLRPDAPDAEDVRDEIYYLRND